MSCLIISHSASDEVRSTVLPTTILFYYNYDYNSVSHLKDKLLEASSSSSIKYFGLHIENKTTKVLSLSGIDKSVINRANIKAETSVVHRFFHSFINGRMPSEGGFVDFFVTSVPRDRIEISNSLQQITRKKISVRFISNCFTSNQYSDKTRQIIELYFNTDKLYRMKNDIISSKSSKLVSSTDSYERIRMVGKGSFGIAILYRRKDDDSLVIIKEINMLELSTQERQLALNEVAVISRLHHPHIISYYDSFEEDGILMIEMEYAEGGTMAQLLANQKTWLEEQQIMKYFEQMLSAVTYLHGRNVLHRDLKTANIFLTKDNDVKVGDFGISKIMSAETLLQGVQTVVGTPYYISPEMCEGKPYNNKSDVWALGCILYEMACLQKTFEGTNLPAVISRIVKGQYDQVQGPYSSELKLLIRQMLKMEASQRPTSKQALEAVRQMRGPLVKRTTRRNGFIEDEYEDCIEGTNFHSALYWFDTSTITLKPVPNLPQKIRIKQIAISSEHHMMLTTRRVVYAWGSNRHGQLGLGNRKPQSEPTIVNQLLGKGVVKIALGTKFSIFCTDRGTALFCGSRLYSGDGVKAGDVLKPILIDSLLREDIVDVSCGEEHVVVIANAGKVFVWGNGANGRLGTGETVKVFTATQIEIPTQQLVISARCGPDSTILLTNSGSIMAMGSNRMNKLNLNLRKGFFSNVKTYPNKITEALTPSTMKPFPSRVVDARLSSTHTGVLLESGHVHFFGNNNYGQLGLGHTIEISDVQSPIKFLLFKACLKIGCGENFSIAATSDNELYFWGFRSNAYDKRHYTNNMNENSKQYECSQQTFVIKPTVILRLATDPGENTFITLSDLLCIGSKTFVAIETVSLSHEQDSPRPSRNALIKRIHHLPLPNQSDSRIETWVQKELEDGEVLPIATNEARHNENNSKVVDQSIKKISSSSANDEHLLLEIEKLKEELMHQSKNCKVHDDQMHELQLKLMELQARQQVKYGEPPPVYTSESSPSKFTGPDSITCSIL